MKKEIPILFSTDMVKAILEGRKSITRRIIKPQPIDNTDIDGNFFEGNHKGYVNVDGHPFWKKQFVYEFSKWQRGDIIWVRETWQLDCNPNVIAYKADGTSRECIIGNKWKPSIYMPKPIARIWMQITEVTIERLQDISTEDAIMEGVDFYEMEGRRYFNYLENVNNCVGAIHSFQSLWKSINGTNSWAVNPYVWVISFKVLSTTGKPESTDIMD